MENVLLNVDAFSKDIYKIGLAVATLHLLIGNANVIAGINVIFHNNASTNADINVIFYNNASKDADINVIFYNNASMDRIIDRDNNTDTHHNNVLEEKKLKQKNNKQKENKRKQNNNKQLENLLNQNINKQLENKLNQNNNKQQGKKLKQNNNKQLENKLTGLWTFEHIESIRGAVTFKSQPPTEDFHRFVSECGNVTERPKSQFHKLFQFSKIKSVS